MEVHFRFELKNNGFAIHRLNHLANAPLKWCWKMDLNHQPFAYKATALPLSYFSIISYLIYNYMVERMGNDPIYEDFQSSANPSQLSFLFKLAGMIRLELILDRIKTWCTTNYATFLKILYFLNIGVMYETWTHIFFIHSEVHYHYDNTTIKLKSHFFFFKISGFL